MFPTFDHTRKRFQVEREIFFGVGTGGNPCAVRLSDFAEITRTQRALAREMAREFPGAGNPSPECPGAILRGQRLSVGDCNGRSRSASEFSPEPCEGESRFVAGRECREKLIDAIRGELGKDRGRSVAPIFRRYDVLMGLECMPVRAFSDAVACLLDTVRLLCGSIRCSVGAVRAHGRMPVAGARGTVLPANVWSTPAACVRGAELDRASRSSTNLFRRGSRIRFGSLHSSHPAFRLF